VAGERVEGEGGGLSLKAISPTTEIPETAVESRFYWYMVSADTQTQKLTNQNGKPPIEKQPKTATTMKQQ